MITNAESRGGKTEYILADINSFDSDEKYDVIHSMEVLYYLDDPSETVKKITDSWLSNNGRLIVGVDHYYENADSGPQAVQGASGRLSGFSRPGRPEG